VDRPTLEEVTRILRHIEELRRHLDRLLANDELPGLTDEIRGVLDRIQERATSKAAEEFRADLARVNFEDQDYKLMRVIDGDTLEVHPPDELTRWMRDVHIRLYGVDAPESNTEHGPTYTAILERLCRLNDGRLHVVWERERQRTEYAGFPTASFERGVGSLFVDIGNGCFLYVNALLASLPDVRIERQTRGFIRAARHLKRWPHPLWHHWHRHWPFDPVGPRPPYPTHRLLEYLTTVDVADLRGWLSPPRRFDSGFVWVLPKETVLRPNEGLDAISRLLREWLRFARCPICSEIAGELAARWPILLEREDATPFDLLLLLAYAWGHEAEPEVSE
jgi:hypothetical protein